MGFMSRWNDPEVNKDEVDEYVHVVQWVATRRWTHYHLFLHDFMTYFN